LGRIVQLVMAELKQKKVFKPVKVNIDVDAKLYLKDPNSSELGLKVLQHGIHLIDKVGFESFTFKKLADKVGATEPSVYRYFESKHKMLLYLLTWYWNWMDYKVILATSNIDSPEERLRIAIRLLSAPIGKDSSFEHIDEVALYRIVVSESSKAYLIKNVDTVNEQGLFVSYKRLCNRVASIVKEINADYRFPRALISTIIESSHDQKFFAEHLPSLTDVTHKRLNDTTEFLTELVFKTISK
jgi:AcrR family transcriptional regulator